MPFSHRDKPKLSERLRGKTGEEILNEIKSDLNPEARMFFDSPSWRSRPNNSGFSRGFPFDDDSNRTDIRTYLDEIAARHPEFADQLKEPPWGDNLSNPSFGRKRRGSDSGREEEGEPSGSGTNPIQTNPESKEHRQNLTNYGLRNTVPLGPGTLSEEEPRQRSMSAPPDNRTADKPKKFVTKCEIPVMNDPRQESASPKPDSGSKGAQEQTQQKANNGPNVRVIPIQVEGRDAPLVNTNIDTASNFGAETYRESPFEGRLPREFGSYQRHSPRFSHKERAPTPPQYQYAPQYQQYQQYAPHPQFFGQPPHQPQFMPQQQFVPPQQQPYAHMQSHAQKTPAPPPSQQHPHQHQHQYPPQQQQQAHVPPPQASKQPQVDEMDSKTAQPPPQTKPETPKDPIEKVLAIQKEVEGLMKQVEAFSGNSRTDKTYLMLDELLTRQLLHLDNIDTEGKENVRQARKDAIRSIQRCISTLENKVPLAENNEPMTEGSKNQKNEKKSEEQAMEVDKTKENTPVDANENQKMEVDEKTAKELQQQPVQEQQLPADNKPKV